MKNFAICLRPNGTFEQGKIYEMDTEICYEKALIYSEEGDFYVELDDSDFIFVFNAPAHTKLQITTEVIFNIEI